MIWTNERKKMIKHIWVKIEKEIERRGDNISLLELPEKKPKKFCIWNYISNFFLKIII